MGFWSTLAGIGKAALPFVPGVGPVASAALNAAGTMAGGAAKQRSADRGAQAEYDAARIPISNAQSMQHAGMKRDAETARLRQIYGADMLGSSKPPTDPRAKLSGAGYVSPESVQLMRSRAMQALQSGSDVPQLQTMPEKPGGGATGMDSFLNALNIGSTALGGLRHAGLLGGDDGGRQSSVNAPADLEASIYGAQEEIPWWSPMRRGN
jgi:hypothetical protein